MKLKEIVLLLIFFTWENVFVVFLGFCFVLYAGVYDFEECQIGFYIECAPWLNETTTLW